MHVNHVNRYGTGLKFILGNSWRNKKLPRTVGREVLQNGGEIEYSILWNKRARDLL